MKTGVTVTVQKLSMTETLIALASEIPFLMLMICIVMYIMSIVFNLNTSVHKPIKAEDINVTFDDIRGISETKEEVKFLVDMLQNWEKLGEVGARPVKGVLFYGPPGTGKTLLAKAIAKEADVKFISASGADFTEMFVGVGAARVRSLWELAVSNSPCILFIDEIDCLGKRRGSGDAATQDSNQTLNALLQKMDGLEATPGILVIGATNRKDDLDQALLRSGRFDRQFYVGPPSSKKDRDEVTELYLENKKLSDDVTVEKASKLLVGLTAADIEEALSESVMISLQNKRDGIIKLSDIDEAVMKIRLGGVRKDHTSKRDELVTAIHESGHTVASLLLNSDVAKVSILAYSSGTGGVTMKDCDKDEDVKLKTQSEFESEIKILLAGKCSEELIIGEHTQGCTNDLEQATKLIYEMVTSYGFGKSLLNENVLMANGLKHNVEGNIIDKCNEMLSRYDEEVSAILRTNKGRIRKLASKLLEEKTVVMPTLEYIDKLEDNDTSIKGLVKETLKHSNE
jgi:cell division protease FtsH